MPNEGAPGTGKVFAIALDLSKPPPEEIDLGASFEIVVAIETESDCDLAGAAFEVREGETIVAAGTLPPLTQLDPASDDYDPREGPVEFRPCARIELAAPREIGKFEWRLALPAQEIAGEKHAEAALPFSFRAGAHKTSLASWDVPSPVTQGETFRAKIGARCSAGCDLRDHVVEVRDKAGALVAKAKLGATPWQGTQALYWCEIEADPPQGEGLCEYTVAFAAAAFGLPHLGATTTFSLMSTGPAPHVVNVTVIDRHTQAPIEDAQVRLGFHRAATNADGVACFRSAGGEQRLFVWKAGFDIPETTVKVMGDCAFRVEGEAQPEEDPYARWTG